jgi:ABC-2 type transport system ATP-binding protein
MVSEGITVFVTTHYMDEAEYCNRLVLIDRGQIVAMGTPTELKTHFMKGQLILVGCEPLGPGLETLSQAPGVMDAAVFGSSLHATVVDAQASMPGIRTALASRGIKVERLEQIPPSLEDVFVNLTTARESKPGRTA